MMAPQERIPSRTSSSSTTSSNGMLVEEEMTRSIEAAAAAATAANGTDACTNHTNTAADPLTPQTTSATSGHHGSFYFLSEDAAHALSEFRYQGQDLSLTYKYVLSPLAEWCVHTLTPRTVAPNTITLIGLVWMIASYGALWYYVPSLLLLVPTSLSTQPKDEEVVPSWVFCFNAIAILIYQTLDNMDGKQARRVGASSPLGLLFDHGCDAINSVFGSANWMVALALSQQHDLNLAFIMLMGPYALFYVSTWEEYYTGKLIMPIVNGPNEGLLGAVAMSLVTACYGTQYWHQHSLWSRATTTLLGPFSYLFNISNNTTTIPPLRNADLLVLASSIGFVQETSLKIWHVVRQHGVGTVTKLLPFATLVACGWVVGRADVEVWLAAPRTSLHLCAVLFVEMVTELMLSHMTKQPYPAVRWILLPLVVLTGAVVTGMWPEQLLTTTDFLLVYSGAAGMFLAVKTVIVIDEISTSLNIWCFDIVTPRRRRRKPQAATMRPTSTMTSHPQQGRSKVE